MKITTKKIIIDTTNEIIKEIDILELNSFINNLRLEKLEVEDILYYSTYSQNYFYNFKIVEISENYIKLKVGLF